MGKKTGAKIKEARTAAGLTQEQLARKIKGLSANDISLAERGEKDLTQALLKEIAKATGVTQTSLLNAEKEPAKTSSGGKTQSSSSSQKQSSSKSSDELKLTAAEKKLIELYRAADSNTKKAAVSVLKGEGSDLQKLLSGFLGEGLGKLLG